MEELQALLRQAQDGDVDAYGQLVRRFQDMGDMLTQYSAIFIWQRMRRKRHLLRPITTCAKSMDLAPSLLGCDRSFSDNANDNAGVNGERL